MFNVYCLLLMCMLRKECFSVLISVRMSLYVIYGAFLIFLFKGWTSICQKKDNLRGTQEDKRRNTTTDYDKPIANYGFY